MWYIIELDLAIFVACGPAFLAFFRHYLPAVFGGSSAGGSRQFKNSYPLGSRSAVKGTHTEHKSGNKTTVSTRDPYFTSPNDSEEMIIMNNGGGIQKQVDVWVSAEDAEAGKVDARSTAEERDQKVG